MAKRYSGLRRFGYSTTSGGTVTWVTGKVAADSTVTPDNIPTETTVGQVYGGSNIEGEVTVLDMADYTALETFMKADTERYWHFEFTDSSTPYVTNIPFNIMVRRNLNLNARDGVTGYTVSFQHNDHEPIV
jgi:hypothetical protein